MSHPFASSRPAASPRCAAVLALVVLAGCGPAKPSLPDPDGGTLDGGATACPSPTGQVIVHRTDITTPEFWAGSGAVHHVTGPITVRPGQTLTLEACAVVQVDPGLDLTVDATLAKPGRLVARGTATQPVRVTAFDPAQRWGAVRALVPGASLELAWATFDHGGSGALRGATLHLRGVDPATPTPMLTADHLAVQASTGVGLLLELGAAFTGASTALEVSGSGNPTDSAALELTPMAAGTLPPLALSGNARDEVRLAAPALAITSSLVLKDRGAPYHFSSAAVTVSAPLTGSGATPTLTLEPGVELRFDEQLVVGAESSGFQRPGQLLAVGTLARPITLTSGQAAPAQGDWGGLWLHTAPGSRLEHVRLRYAGGYNGYTSTNCRPPGSSDRAALVIGPNTPPVAADYVDVTVSDSQLHGIDATWSASDFGPDLTAAFTFSGVAGCKQTKNARFAGCGAEAGCLVP